MKMIKILKIFKKINWLMFFIVEILSFNYFIFSNVEGLPAYIISGVNCLINIIVYFDILKECEDNEKLV